MASKKAAAKKRRKVAAERAAAKGKPTDAKAAQKAAGKCQTREKP